MSKNRSVQEKHKEIRRERQAAEKAERKRTLIKRITIIAISVVLIAAIVITCVIVANNRYKKTNEYKTGTVVMKSDHYTVDLAMFTYYFFDGYYGYVDMYGENLKEMNMYPDITKDLRDQYYSDGSWYDFIMNSAGAQLQQNLLLAEAALEEGITLTDNEKAALAARAESIDVTKYGEGVTNEDVRRCLELDYIAVKYEYETRHTDMLEGEMLEDYYDEFYKHFSTVSFRCIEIPYSDSEYSTVSKAEAERYANEIASAKNSDEFTQKIRENVRFINPELTDENIEQIIETSFAKDVQYSEGDIVTEWLFDEKRQVNDVYVYDNIGTESITTYLMTDLITKDMYDTVNVRHIFFDTDTYGSEDAAFTKANELKGLWEEGGKNEQMFAELAVTYSEDRVNCYLGGLLENYTKEDMEEAYPEIAKWAFGDVKAGDSSVVKTANGYSLVMFVKEGLPSALARTQAQVSSEEFAEKFMQFEGKYKVEMTEALNDFSNV